MDLEPKASPLRKQNPWLCKLPTFPQFISGNGGSGLHISLSISSAFFLLYETISVFHMAFPLLCPDRTWVEADCA